MEDTIKKRQVGRPPALDPKLPKIKDVIMEKTIEVLSEQGLLHFSLKDVSRRAEVTPAAIYYYFQDKKRLAEETLDRYLLPVIREYWDVMDEVSDPSLMIRTLLRKILKASREFPWFLQLWSGELADDKQPLREYFTERARYSALLNFSQKIKKGQDEGLINPSLIPEILYFSLISTVYALVLARRNWEKVLGKEISAENLEKHIMAFALEGILAPEKERP
jgi:AcrR family transcriptional regulator